MQNGNLGGCESKYNTKPSVNVVHGRGLSGRGARGAKKGGFYVDAGSAPPPHTKNQKITYIVGFERDIFKRYIFSFHPPLGPFVIKENGIGLFLKRI